MSITMEQLSPQINFILIEHSNYCNMNCPYCRHWGKIIDKQLASVEVIKQAYKIAEEQPNLVEVAHLYTEPLLNFDNLKIAAEQSRRHNVVDRVFSNGLLMTPDKMDFFLRQDFGISISFDGLFQDNRKPGTKDCLEKLCYDYPYCFTVLTTILKKDKESFIKNLEYLLSLPVISIVPSLDHYGNWTEKEIIDLYSPLTKFSRSDRERLCLTEISTESPRILLQSHRINGLYVGCDGKLYQYIFPGKKIYLGSVFEYSPIKDFSKIRFFNQDPQRCIECPLLTKCNISDYNVEIKIGDKVCFEKKILLNLFGGEG